jgi:hypothetical protein
MDEVGLEWFFLLFTFFLTHKDQVLNEEVHQIIGEAAD